MTHVPINRYAPCRKRAALLNHSGSAGCRKTGACQSMTAAATTQVVRAFVLAFSFIMALYVANFHRNESLVADGSLDDIGWGVLWCAAVCCGVMY